MKNQLDVYLSGIDTDQPPIVQTFDKHFENQMNLHFRNISNKDVTLDNGWECKLCLVYGNKSGCLTTKNEINNISFILPNHVYLKSKKPIFDNESEEGTVTFEFNLDQEVIISKNDDLKIKIIRVYSNTPIGRTPISIGYEDNGEKQLKKIDISKEKLHFYIEKFETETVPGIGYTAKVKWNVKGCSQVFLNQEAVLSVGEKDVVVTGEMDLVLNAIDDKGNEINQVINIIPSGPIIKVFEFKRDIYHYYNPIWEVLYADEVTLDGKVVVAKNEWNETFLEQELGIGGIVTITEKHDLWASGYGKKEVSKHIEITYTYQVT